MDSSSSKYLHTTFQYLIHIVNIPRVSLNREVHECNLQFQEPCHFNRLSLLLNDLVRVFLEQLEYIEFLIYSDYVFFSSVGSELRQLFHEVYEDRLDVDGGVQITGGVKEGLKGLEMVLIGKNLDDTVHEILLRHRVLADNDDLEDLREDHGLVDIICDTLKMAQTNNILAYSHS